MALAPDKRSILIAFGAIGTILVGSQLISYWRMGEGGRQITASGQAAGSTTSAVAGGTLGAGADAKKVV
jgi:hypothetical protein